MDFLIEDLEEAKRGLMEASSLFEKAGFHARAEDLCDMIDDTDDDIKDARAIQEQRWEAENRQANIEYRAAIGI